MDWLKKGLHSSTDGLRRFIDAEHPRLSVRRQCELVGLCRSSLCYEPARETPANLELMRQIDEPYLRRPFFGSRRLADELGVNRKRMQRLMRLMGLEAIYPKPRTTQRGADHKIYPYLPRTLEITRPDQVWSADITYIQVDTLALAPGAHVAIIPLSSSAPALGDNLSSAPEPSILSLLGISAVGLTVYAWRRWG